MKHKTSMFSLLYIVNSLIVLLFLNQSSCSPNNLVNEVQELKIKAITSVELSLMSFNEIPSLFFLYENLVNKKFESLHKSDPKKVEKFEEFRKIHQYHAIKNSFYSLKLRDVVMIESFNAEDLEIIRNKVNWTDNEITQYGFLGKEKVVPKYQFWKKDLIFPEKALADFFIAQYFYDNLFHPKDYPSDDEMELRIRFFLHVTADNYHRRPLTNEFIMAMIEDQNEEIFSDQVRMIMKYRFKYLLDRFLPDRMEFIEKISQMFSKDREILGNLWRIDQNQPYFLRFFRFTSSNDKVYKLREIAKKFFTFGGDVDSKSNLESNSTESTTSSTKLEADNVLRGQNQILNVLYIIHGKKDENFTKDILEVTQYKVSNKILNKLKLTPDFLDFVDLENFAATEKREFYLANCYELISNSKNGSNLMQLWERMKKYFNRNELKGILTQKEHSYNQTQLFLLPSDNNQNYVETFFTLIRSYLSNDEIKHFLTQRHPISQESFLTRYIKIIRNVKILEMNYNFAKTYLSHAELKELLFDNNDVPFIRKISNNEVLFTFCMKILSEFYTKDEIRDMLMETDEYETNIIFWMVTSGSGMKQRHDAADYLKEIFKDHEDKLKKLLAARNDTGQTAFGIFRESYDNDGLEPFLNLAKEIFTEEEIEELYKDQKM